MTTEDVALKFDLTVTLSRRAPAQYAGYLKRNELVRRFTHRFTMSISNSSGRSFPGCGIRLIMEEHGPGPSANPLRWWLRDTINVPKLAKNESWTYTYGIIPLIDGLYIVTATVESVAEGNVKPEAVSLVGYRSAGSRTATFYYTVLSPHDLQVEKKLDGLLSQFKYLERKGE